MVLLSGVAIVPIDHPWQKELVDAVMGLKR